ncbi:CATRA conflict system CASPASE/TPR repeat-associated protein [Streptomyces sp. NPDC046881]|uniref:CATRA conflict system CASPASE/TPR repeat-associated protein n=1 Tax=Streptomyces sp. NPDC046881 TaxID=3155374 RepID=UPI0033E3D3A5
MTRSAPAPADQELVVHVYAPTDGPYAKRAYAQILGIWDGCRDRLDMVHRIPETGLPAHLPPEAGMLSPGRPAAAIEDRTGGYQAIVRREHDVVNLSMAFSAPVGTPSRSRTGSLAPPGWIEYDRWWDALAAGGTDALLGVVRICLAKSAGHPASPLDMTAHAVRAVLPGADHAPYWWLRGWTTDNGFAVWEVSPDDEGAGRRVVVLAAAGQDAQLSAWAWSQGDPDMPPLARYLMHAAKLRYQARVRSDGEQLSRLVDRVDDLAAQTRGVLERPADGFPALSRLRLAEADLTLAATDVRSMRRTVDIAVANMTASLSEPFPADRRLAEALVHQLADDAEYLAAAREKAQEIGRLARLGLVEGGRTRPGSELSPGAELLGVTGLPPATRHRAPEQRISLRMGFAVDVERYSSRTSPAKESVQERLAVLVREVLDDLGYRLEETSHQSTGDGMNVFLPAGAELHRALPRLVRSWQEHLAADNDRFSDRMRLRMATVVGPTGKAALGFSGSTIVEISRLLNSSVLRDALTDHPEADFAVLVSDQLYEYVVGEGYPGLAAHRFERLLVEDKEYRGQAWLWLPEPTG